MALITVLIQKYITYDCSEQFEISAKQHIVILIHGKMQVWVCKFLQKQKIYLP